MRLRHPQGRVHGRRRAALALTLLHAQGSRPTARQPGEALSSPVVERTPAPAPPTSSRTVQAAGKRTAPARQTVRPEREPSHAPAVAPDERRAAASDARVFLHGYLPYSYGRVGADRIRGAAPPLVRALQEAPPRVPAAVARARPRLASVLAEAASGDGDVVIVAAVDAVWPRAVVVTGPRRREDESPSWRFSGRHWNAPVADKRRAMRWVPPPRSSGPATPTPLARQQR